MEQSGRLENKAVGNMDSFLKNWRYSSGVFLLLYHIPCTEVEREPVLVYKKHIIRIELAVEAAKQSV
jgi:hypothetical protein